MDSEEGKLRQKRQIEKYYERVRQKQKAEGTYNPYRNGNVAPDDQKINSIVVNRFNEETSDMTEKYRTDKTLLNW